MQGYLLKEGKYRSEDLSDDELWDTFNWMFSSYSKNNTSYKFIFLKSIIDCIDKNNSFGRISFDTLFERFTELSWNLVVKYELAQKKITKEGVRSSLENIICKYSYDEELFVDLLDYEKKNICLEIKKYCKKYVVGALYSDTEGRMYSFSKKEEWIELNPVFEKFIKDNKTIIEKLNFNKWAKFYEYVNGIEKAYELNKRFQITDDSKHVYRKVLEQEFEKNDGQENSIINTFELLLLADSIVVDEVKDVEQIDEGDIEEVLYKDYSDMRRYLNDPIELIYRLKASKGII